MLGKKAIKIIKFIIMENTEKIVDVFFDKEKIYAKIDNGTEEAVYRLLLLISHGELEVWYVFTGRVYVYVWLHKCKEKRIVLKSLTRVSQSYINVDLYDGLFTLSYPFKHPGLSPRRVFEVVIKGEDGKYRNITEEIISFPNCKFPPQITAFKLDYGVYDVHLKAPGYDQTFHFVYDQGQWQRLLTNAARRRKEKAGAVFSRRGRNAAFRI